MIEERQPLRAHKISLSNRSLGVITGVKDVVSFDLNEIILDTDQGLLMIKGKNLHVKKLLVEKGEVEITGKIDSFLYSNIEEPGKKEGDCNRSVVIFSCVNFIWCMFAGNI